MNKILNHLFQPNSLDAAIPSIEGIMLHLPDTSLLKMSSLWQKRCDNSNSIPQTWLNRQEFRLKLCRAHHCLDQWICQFHFFLLHFFSKMMCLWIWVTFIKIEKNRSSYPCILGLRHVSLLRNCFLFYYQVKK